MIVISVKMYKLSRKGVFGRFAEKAGVPEFSKPSVPNSMASPYACWHIEGLLYIAGTFAALRKILFRIRFMKRAF